jgi:hypothetical protein
MKLNLREEDFLLHIKKIVNNYGKSNFKAG